MRLKMILMTAAGWCLTAGAEARTLEVCPQTCAYSDIQTAVDAATDGDTIRLGAGVYKPAAYRDIPYGKLTIRGFVVLDNRRLTITGEGAVLDDADGVATSALVIRGGQVTLSGLTIRNFHAVDTKDDIYDGHGIFQIGGRTRLRNLTIEGVTKMALVVREDGMADATGLTIAHNGVGIWTDERARLRLRKSTVDGNTYSGLAVYAETRTELSEVAFNNHTDDAIFIDGQAQVRVTRSTFRDNKPLVFNLNDRAILSVSGSLFCHNEAVSKMGLDALGGANKECKE
ncbi:right-handed parallel beta-helix repeat-containing protein [Asticcacaulis sp.]|uniref:right-handed parallel beta-helix repeat-containing protein n=1 Tax=Asticcacaulis sp. TaxID=1872648 RepID=UPI002C781ABE|nr:right-handed parallel beta-helix repeat-containing protein [Asticcacaulis sp.]HTM81392.1 right-handed parallel beta-helix repeat-containing protein [Asticcacaulis sp.]